MQHLVPKKKTTQKTWCKTSLLLKSTNYLRLIRGLYEVTVGVCLIYFSVKNHLHIVRWEDLKVNEKMKMDLSKIVCDVKLMAVALERCQFPRNS